MTYIFVVVANTLFQSVEKYNWSFFVVISSLATEQSNKFYVLLDYLVATCHFCLWLWKMGYNANIYLLVFLAKNSTKYKSDQIALIKKD